jgi:hypothetical protein
LSKSFSLLAITVLAAGCAWWSGSSAPA